ncbi:thymidylate kinase-domain-containing protein [Pholiota molesta]|nr:thymidylate kinase-domain-containing protein [Pholiota molesta]
MASQAPPRRAPFIVIEGLDRSGKTTQVARLHAQLKAQGVEAALMKFPDRSTQIGQMIDAYLRSAAEMDDRAVHLLFSANRWELASKIEATLLAGTPVLCDRYAFSGIAFSAAKVATAPAAAPNPTASSPAPPTPPTPLLPYEWCRAPDVGLPAPDLERYEQEEVQQRVRAVFKEIGREMDRRRFFAPRAAPRWVEVDAGRERDAVEREVWGLVRPLVEGGVAGPVGKLWAGDED